MPTIKYNKGTPTEKGVYACRIPSLEDEESFAIDILEDKFLVWYEEKWWFPLSDQRFRGTVLGWIGPLQRRLSVIHVENGKNCKAKRKELK